MARTLPARSRRLPRLPPTGGAPPKTERPESFPADRPIDHHVAGHTAEHPDKPGRPRNDRNHSTPQPLAPDLTKAPVQISRSVAARGPAGTAILQLDVERECPGGSRGNRRLQ